MNLGRDGDNDSNGGTRQVVVLEVVRRLQSNRFEGQADCLIGNAVSFSFMSVGKEQTMYAWIGRSWMMVSHNSPQIKFWV